MIISRGYYKFQVEIGVVTNWDSILKLCVKHNFIIFYLVLYGDYLSAATIWITTVNQQNMVIIIIMER